MSKKSVKFDMKRLPNLQPCLKFDGDNQENASREATLMASSSPSQYCGNPSQQNMNGNISAQVIQEHDDKPIETLTAIENILNGFEDDAANISQDLIKLPRACSSDTALKQRKPKGIIIKQQAPTFLIIESLVWTLVKNSEPDQEKQCKLFRNICYSLKQFKVLGYSFLEESLQPLRDKLSMVFAGELSRQRELILSINDPRIDLPLVDNRSNRCTIDPNRYKDEFIEICVISKGGFGIVKKAKHKFDNQVYAIKEITFLVQDYTSFEHIVKEAKIYANLEPHPNVVTYKTSWIQVSAPSEPRSRTSSHSSAKSRRVPKKCKQAKLSSSEDSDENLQIEFAKGASDSSEAYVEEEEESSGDKVSPLRDSKSSESDPENDHHHKRTRSGSIDVVNEIASLSFDENLRLLLYIQMELCGDNLRTYLDNRNAAIFSQCDASQNALELVDAKFEGTTFCQIVSGVDYIHKKNFIHRDLKPHNVLFSLDKTSAKITDFGLATREQVLPMNILEQEGSSGGKHTDNIGTKCYAAPEQKRPGASYDHRVDLYPLGIILFELFYPVHTLMEFSKVVDDLKLNRVLPSRFVRKWPILADLILKLTSEDITQRPHISTIKAIIEHNVLNKSEHHNNPEIDMQSVLQENHVLKSYIAELEKELEDLKKTKNVEKPCCSICHEIVEEVLCSCCFQLELLKIV